ncbi:MAG: methionine synthase [Chloroflexi bacterium]|nr:methionine synthase [Chloroflexota bacterium]MBM3154349.1 methionine synthase [Chloroflexota bacterium]MBM3173947.1 methionine synthase [Chloroflexota bacterium]MBM3174711.1 methionine synthase [Chloroflexota bacterium]MBM4449802.1 methionine synthase [Chloroflexota bacterium]
MKAEFNCLPTAIGSMPHADPKEACSIVARYLRDVPHWPQLPQRSQLENMYVQFSEDFPGLVLEGTKLFVERKPDFDAQLEQLYTAASENKADDYGISEKYAAGLYALADAKLQTPKVIKGQITGPISWGLCTTDRQQRGILYDDLLAEALAKFLRLKAMWQERFLKAISPHTLIFVDEPYLTSLGTAFVAIPDQQVTTLLEEVFSGIEGLKGIHCCGTTNWSLLLKTSADVLSFDAYNYADSLSCYPSEVKVFLERGSAVAWGIVPNDEDALARETVSSLNDRLGEAMAPFTRDGVPFKQIVTQSMLTPSCALGMLSPDAAVQVLRLLSELSTKVRSHYG